MTQALSKAPSTSETSSSTAQSFRRTRRTVGGPLVRPRLEALDLGVLLRDLRELLVVYAHDAADQVLAQCADGLKDGASHCAKLLTIMYDNLDSDAQDPVVIIKVDISYAFNVLCRYLSLNVLSGTASRDYASGLKFGDSIATSCDTLRNMFPYFQAMRTCTPILRYYDCFGQVHTAQSKTGGQQGDPLEMTVFNLSIH